MPIQPQPHHLRAAGVRERRRTRCRPGSRPCRRLGPAKPVVATPRSVPNLARTPSAIARATGSLTAPNFASSSRRHAEFAVLHLVGVRHHAAAEVVAGPGHQADAVRHQPAGDALRRRQRLPLLVQQPHDHVLQFLVLDAEHEVAEPLADRRLDRGDLRLRLRQRSRPGPGCGAR